MKKYFAKHQNGNITVCNIPFKEKGAKTYAFEVTQEDMDAVQDGTKDWDITDRKLKTKPSTRKAEYEAKKAAEKAEQEALKAEKEALKAKMNSGTATTAEIQQALSKLL